MSDKKDTPAFKVPYGWVADKENGIKKIAEDGKLTDVCNNLVIITKRLINVEDKEERLEIKYMIGNSWHSIIQLRSLVFDHGKVIKLADHSIQVSSLTAKDLVRYFNLFIKVNEIPVIESVSKMGWMRGGRFFPYCENVIYDAASSGGVDLLEAMQPKGCFDDWVTEVKKYRNRIGIRLMLAASLASPLISLVQHRIFFVYLHEFSKSGKTAALKMCNSVWGNPIRLMSVFSSTMVGLEYMCSALNNLPFCLDERQVLDEKKLSVAELIYNLCEGKGKTRGNKSGGIQKFKTWNNLVLATGEEPLINMSTQQGVQSRVVEINSKPFKTETDAAKAHRFFENNYGTAGKIFIEKTQNRDTKADKLKIHEAVKAIAEPHYHLDNISILGLADFYGSMFLFDEPEEVAFDSAISMCVDFIDFYSLSQQNDDIYERAWGFTKDWITKNSDSFKKDPRGLIYGKHDEDKNKCYIIISVMKDALRKEGFAPEQIVKGFFQRGYFEKIVDDDGTEKTSIIKKIQNKATRVYVARLDPIPESEKETTDKVDTSEHWTDKYSLFGD